MKNRCEWTALCDEWLYLWLLAAAVMGKQRAWFLTVTQSWSIHGWRTAGMVRPVTGGVWMLPEESISSTITWRAPEKPRAPADTPPTARGTFHCITLLSSLMIVNIYPVLRNEQFSVMTTPVMRGYYGNVHDNVNVFGLLRQSNRDVLQQYIQHAYCCCTYNIYE